MPLDPAQIQAAIAVQHAAAHDGSTQIRVIAGPGTGKSATIEERIHWLLLQGTDPTSIQAISFTRASARDLRDRVKAHCQQQGQAGGEEVRITTLHALALRALRAAGLLAAYATDPIVLDQWEQEHIFDAEFASQNGIGKARTRDVRVEHEAYWSTGNWAPANYLPPDPPITPMERGLFTAFHQPRTHLYSCVLPGELIREVVSRVAAGMLDVVALLGLQNLIVDEYQDLNPMDLALIDALAAQGATLFICGDDDQSLYSFRYALPEGIQQFVGKYPNCGQHSLDACFRTTPSILAAAQMLITTFSHPNRIPKNHFSLYQTAIPPTPGVIYRWRFQTAAAEAGAIGESCRDLIAAGVHPRDILILLSNQRQLLTGICAALGQVDVPFEAPHAERFIDSPAGRLIFALIRIVCNPDDYVAYRTLVGLKTGVGISTCNSIANAVIVNNLNLKSMFFDPLPAGVFTARAGNALSAARAVVGQLQGWAGDDGLSLHMLSLSAIVTSTLGNQHAQEWGAFATTVPADISLSELRDLMAADNDEQQEAVLHGVYQRLQIAPPGDDVLPPRVRIMTMHGSKGLSAKVVLIPGLEDQILPGPWRAPYPGLVLEAARLLYVSLTRARAACIVSYARTRYVNGQQSVQVASRFAPYLAGQFAAKNGGLTVADVQQVCLQIGAL